MNCPACGTPASANWNVCPQCGTSLKSDSIDIEKSGKAHTQNSQLYSFEVNRPSHWQYVIGILIIVMAFGMAIGILINEIIVIPETRVAVPGSHELVLESTGKHIIFYEYRSSLNGKEYSTSETLPAMSMQLEQKDTSVPVSVSFLSGNTSYEILDRAGSSFMEFEIDEPGTYIITAEYEPGTTGPEVVLSIRSFDISGVISQILIILLAGFLVGGIIIIRAFIKRRQVGRQPNTTPVDRIFC